MNLKKNILYITISLSLYFTNTFGQGIHSSRFNFTDYNGGLENWDICSVGKNIAVANQQGLMLYRNGSWQTNSVKNSIAPKSLYYFNNKLYTAFGNTIGYFNIKNDTLSGTFNPILLPVEIKNFALIWKIVSDGKSLFYQTDQHVIQLKDDKAIKVHPFKGFVRCIFEVNKDIYFVDNELGLLKNFSPLTNGTSIAGKQINIILPFKNGDLLISENSTKKFLRYNGTTFTTIWSNKIIEDYPFCGIKSNHDFIIGTTDKGFFIVSEKGKIQKNINAKNFIAYNKVFALHKDANGFIWAGLENGIERFSFDLPYSNIDFESLHGNPENIQTIDSTTFFMTSFGLFELKNNELFHPNAVNQIRNWNNTKGPSYFIKKINNALVYGNIFGTFAFENGKTKNILNIPSCSRIMIINDNYFLVKANREWYLFSSYDNEIKLIQKTKLPNEFEVIEGKIIWSFGKIVFEKDFDSEMNFGSTKTYKVQENIERLFVKNDTLFMTNCLGTFFISASKNNNLITTKYDEHHIYEFDNKTTHLEYNYLLRPVFFDSNFPNKKQISHFVTAVLNVNKDKLKFIKQLNDSLLCLGTYKGFTLINTHKVRSNNEIYFSVHSSYFQNGIEKKMINFENELFLPVEKITFSVLLEKQLAPQTPYFRLITIKDDKIIVGEWSTDLSLSINDFESGNYEVSIECKDWFGNIKRIPATKFTISKEHKIELLLKILFFSILVVLIFIVVLRFRKK